jgi:hypothetical protein
MITFKPYWPAAMLDQERFKLTAVVVLPEQGVEGCVRLELVHVKSQIMVETTLPADATKETQREASKALYPQLVDKLVEAAHHEFGTHEFARLLRCLYANKLIEVISSYGRCFFYSSKHDRTAQMIYDGGTVSLIDEKSGRQVILRNNGDWSGFGHGGTLRDLVMRMRDYVMRGGRIDMDFIGLQRTFGKGNIWGYPHDQMEKCREAARRLPCMAPPPVPHKRENAA